MSLELLPKKWLSLEFPGLVNYQQVLRLQKELVKVIHEDKIKTNILLVVEHLPVFTLGRRGGLNNLTVTDDFLKEKGISIVQVERGGDITYHGPGQLVVYPIINLRSARISVKDYVERLEEVMIKVVGQWGIIATRNQLNRGIWVDNKKLGSIGIAIRHGITFHGFALNVNPSLEPFEWIHSCGLHNISITSMETELSDNVSLVQVRQAFYYHFEQLFGVELDLREFEEKESFFI